MRAEMFHAIKEHLAADADAHLENRTAKLFWLSAPQPQPPHPSAPFRFACSPHLPPPSCFQPRLLFSTSLTAAASPGGGNGNVCSQMPRAKGRFHPALPEGPTNTLADLGCVLRAHL